MLTTTHVASNQTPLVRGGESVRGTGTPETGEFDFMDYILGLQESSPMDSLNSLGRLPPADEDVSGGSELKKQKTEDGILDSITNKNSTSWNPIFPGLVPAAVPLQTQTPLSTTTQDSNDAQPVKTAMLDGKIPAGEVKNFTRPEPSTEAMPLNSKKTLEPEWTKTSDEKLIVGLTPTKTPEEFTQALAENASDVASPNTNSKETGPLTPTPLQKSVEGNLNNNQVSAAQRDVALQRYGASAKPQIKGDLLTASAQSSEATSSLKMAEINPNSDEREIGVSPKRNSDSGDLSAEMARNASTINVSSNGSSTTVFNSAAKSESANSPATLPEVMQRVDSMVHNGGGKMTVSLNPPHLGQVEISVTTRGRKVEVEMTSSNSLTKSLLENSMGALKTSLQSQNLTLAKMDVHVSHDMNRNPGENPNGFQQSFENHQNAFSQSQGQSGRERSTSDRFSTNPERNSARNPLATASPERGMRIAEAGSGRVDLRI